MRKSTFLALLRTLALVGACCAIAACDDSTSEPGPNTVVGSVVPVDGISATVGDSRTIRITFNTDDGSPATALAVTDLASLPDGWSSDSGEFGCAQIATGTICQLVLTYAPGSPASGTVTLHFDYANNRGTAKHGSVAIPYAATSDNSVVGMTTPSGQIEATVGESIPVTVSFTSDDGATATDFSVTTDLSALPAGWSSAPTSLECASMGVGESCMLTLTYAPAETGSGTLSLAFDYTNNSGIAKSGTVDIPFQARAPRLYAGQLTAGLNACSIEADGTLSACANTGGFATANGIAFKDHFAYVADYYNSVVSLCSVAADGSVSNCASTGSEFYYPFALTVSGDFLYAVNSMSGHTITYCTIQSDGTLSGCAETSTLEGAEGLAIAGGYAYVSQPNTNTISVCPQNGDGSIGNCAMNFGVFAGPENIAISGNYLYIANGQASTVSTCALNSATGSISSCINSTVDSSPMGIALKDNHAYVSTRNGLIYRCDVGGAGALSSCVVSNGGATFGLLVQLAIH